MRIERLPGTDASTSPTYSGRNEATRLPVSDDPDSFQFSEKDLTRDGRVPIIVYSGEELKMGKAKRLLKTSRNGSTYDRDLPLVNGFSARVSPRDMGRVLTSLPDGAGVRLNSWIAYPNPNDLSEIAKDATGTIEGTPQTGAAAQVDTSRQTIGLEKMWERGFTGKGVGIAIIDSGIHPHPDLKDRIKGWVDIAEGRKDPYDSFGHGTHVAGDAAGTGVKSAGKIKGAAPDADLIGVRITTVAEAIKGIQWVIENKDKYNIKVVNMSLGDFATKSHKDDPWTQVTQKAIEAGLVVVVAAGNEGPEPGTISTPATSPRVITVGALDDKRTVDRKDDQMASFSSRGPTSVDNLSKPDLIAPGVSVFAPLSPGSTLDVPELPHIGKDYIAISGTSMATPLVSGVAAALLQANPNLTHDDVKKLLTETADHYLADDGNAQGAGLINPLKALEVALAMKEKSAVA
ncbi:MAG: S8 family peptidase [Armatimonadetes bacterium]|nr:S8 family peptidase [Armatimonadota bacterium]